MEKQITFDENLGVDVIMSNDDPNSEGFYSEPDSILEMNRKTGQYIGMLNGRKITGMKIYARRAAGFNFEYFTVDTVQN